MKTVFYPLAALSFAVAGCTTVAPAPNLTPEQRAQACFQINNQMGQAQQEVLQTTLSPQEEQQLKTIRGLAQAGGVAAAVTGIGGLGGLISTAAGGLTAPIAEKEKQNAAARQRLTTLQRDRVRYGC